MTDANWPTPIESDRYREMARYMRALVPMLKHSEAVEDLRLLAARYERLAEYLEAALGTTPERE